MHITPKMIEELLSDDGHAGEIIYTSESRKVSRKEGTIAALKKLGAKNVIHVGCCGHLINVKKQVAQNTSFHLLLEKEFDTVIGFDICEDAVLYLSDYAKHVYAYDLISDYEKVSQIIDTVFQGEDYVILIPEVLEHIPNPADFLSKIIRFYGKQNVPVVLTVPNAYGFGRICNALFYNKESINMDHKFMFTPTTICKVMAVSGLKPTEISFLDLYRFSRIFRKPICANTILVVGTIFDK